MADLDPNAAANDGEEDISSIVHDVFGFDNGPTTGMDGNEELAKPSVGTEGEGGDGVQPTPPSTPSPTPAPAAATPPVAQPPAADPAPGATPQAPAADPAVPEALTLQSLKAQNEALQALVNNLSKPAAPAAPAPGGQDPGPGQADGFVPPAVNPIQLQLPPQLLEAVFGEDPAKAAAGLNQIVSLLATGITHRVETRYAQALHHIKSEFLTRETAAQNLTADEQAAAQRQQYFDQFKDHDKPVLKPIVAQEAMQLAAELPGVPWGPDFINALGARVNQKLVEAGFQPQTPTPSPTPTPAPAAMLPAGARPSPDAEGDIISETMSF